MANRDEIEAQILAAPTEDAAYLILGDLLQLEGDPRGELIALDAAALAGTQRGKWNHRRMELLQRHPELAPNATGSNIHLDWHLGFVRRVSIGTSAGYLEQFEHPAFRYATELVLLDPESASFSTFLVEVVKRMPLLRLLAIGDPDRRHYYWPRPTPRLDLPALVDKLPQLEHLYSCDAIVIGNAPRLRTLRLEGDPSMLEHLQTASFPVLERLSLTDAITRKEQAFDQLRWLLETPPPALRDLELIGIEGNDFLAALADSPLLKQLRALRVWNSGVTAAGARAITREAFGHLDLLDLSDPLLDDATIAHVTGICREVRTISPWVREITRRPG